MLKLNGLWKSAKRSGFHTGDLGLGKCFVHELQE